MYEPKYQLNKKDAVRWRLLLTRSCMELPGLDGKVKRHPAYPPLSVAENAEFERLDRKRHRKIRAHPKVAESIHRSRLALRRTERLRQKLERVLLKSVKFRC